MNRWTFIRQLAVQTLADYKRKTGREPFSEHNGSHAVLAELAERCFGLMVETDSGLSETTQGELNRDEGTITYHPGLLSQCVALVIAHELGHTALDHPPRQIQDSRDDIDEQPLGDHLLAQNGIQPAYNTRDRWELEANVFAVELLAPAFEVRKRMGQGWSVDKMAAYFGLSKAAMHNQLAAVFLCNPSGEATGGTATTGQAAESTGTSPVDSAVSEVGQPKPEMDEQQARAARAEAPALVIAGPGAGKTGVLIERFLLLVNSGVDPRRILALTFSNKAVAEMRERLCAVLPGREYEISVFTFHSFGLQILMAHGESLGYPSIGVLSQTDAFVFLRDRMEKLPMGSYESLTKPPRFLIPLLDAFSRAKDELCHPEQFQRLAAEWLASLGGRAEPEDSEATSRLQEEKKKARACVDAAAIYSAYQELLRENGFVDYGDLIAQSVRLFDNPEVAQNIRGDFDHILVDEFQDVNYASGRLVKVLDGGDRKVWAVGDPRQNIYKFRGASSANIAGFKSDYPNASTLELTVNYRSVEDIVQAGQAVRFPVPESERSLFPPELEAHRGRPSSEPAIQVATAPDAASETAAVAAFISNLLETSPPEHIAVLCRKNAMARRISEALEAQGIPTNWGGHLEERATFKDLVGVLLLASDSPQGLLRLSRLEEHQFAEADLRLLMGTAHKKRSALGALYAAAQGELEGLTAEGRQQAGRMKALAGRLQALPDAWRVLACYLFEAAAWPRDLFRTDTIQARRALATAGQIANLAREFSLKSTLPGGSGTKAFIDYIRSCRQCGCLDCTDTAHVLPGAVTVTTIHKSKGLEWPIVLVPGLVKKAHPEQDRVPLPPGLVRGAPEHGDAFDEACVFYVAVTRAQDRLVLTHFEKEGNNRSVPASPHLGEMIAKLEPGGYLKAFSIENAPDGDAGATPGDPGWSLPDPVPYRMLECYLNCSQQFKYRYVYGLDDDDREYLVFHGVLYQTLEWINERTAGGRVPSEEEIHADLEGRWSLVAEKTDERFRELHRRGAVDHALAFARRSQPGKALHLRQKRTVEVEGHRIEIVVDEIEAGPPPIVRQHKLGRRAKSHTDQTILALLPLVEVDERPPEIRLRYLEDEEVCARTSRFNTSRRQKVVSIISDIRQGKFVPSPNDKKCAACPFNLICPV